MAKNLTWFVYQEQEPPLRGEARKRDYHRQYEQWRRATQPDVAKYHREATRRWHQDRRARQLAVAREYGAEL